MRCVRTVRTSQWSSQGGRKGKLMLGSCCVSSYRTHVSGATIRSWDLRCEARSHPVGARLSVLLPAEPKGYAQLQERFSNELTTFGPTLSALQYDCHLNYSILHRDLSIARMCTCKNARLRRTDSESELPHRSGIFFNQNRVFCLNDLDGNVCDIAKAIWPSLLAITCRASPLARHDMELQ